LLTFQTIQSISLLAYLAEKHNLWGPFLVITPVSTLHNWIQEINRFVPALNVIPYWGQPKDREVLRSIWCKRHATYDRDSKFHVLVTSYQMVCLLLGAREPVKRRQAEADTSGRTG
jgi:DNA helicase INO80